MIAYLLSLLQYGRSVSVLKTLPVPSNRCKVCVIFLAVRLSEIATWSSAVTIIAELSTCQSTNMKFVTHFVSMTLSYQLDCIWRMDLRIWPSHVVVAAKNFFLLWAPNFMHLGETGKWLCYLEYLAGQPFRPSFPSLIFYNSINTITDLFPVWGTPGG